MFGESRIAERLTDQFGDRFSDLLKQHGSLAVFWRECPDMGWDLTRSMFWASPHRQSYFLKLCEFLRPLDVGLKSLDEKLAFQRVVLEEKYAKEIDGEEIVAYELLMFVWGLVDMWTRAACLRAKDEADKAIPVGGYRKSESERDAYIISTQQSFMQAQANQLRELIPNLFVPNMAPLNESVV